MSIPQRPQWQRLAGEALRFLLGGASTTLVSYVVYLLLLPHVSYLIAYTAAYAIGIGWSYLANTLFVFRRRPSIRRAMAFPLVYAVQYLVGSMLLVLLVDQLKVAQSIAPLAVVILTLPVTYVLSRWIITAKS